MSAPIQSQASDLLDRVRRTNSALYQLEVEAEEIGLTDLAGHLFNASIQLTSAACSLHPDREGTDLTRLTAEQMAKGDETAVRT